MVRAFDPATGAGSSGGPQGAGSIEGKLNELGIVLPQVPAPLANYVPYVITGDLLFLAGQAPRSPDGTWHMGKVGVDISVDEAYHHARLVGVQILAVLQSAFGSLDRVEQVVKLLGFVNTVPGFKDHPRVINGCSDLMLEVFGERGCHARSAVGVDSLPGDFTVEIEGIVRFR